METVQLLGSYDLQTAAELREQRPRPEDERQLVEHIAAFSKATRSAGSSIIDRFSGGSMSPKLNKNSAIRD